MRDSRVDLRLLDSPLTIERRRHGLGIQEAAVRLGIASLRLVRLEAATRRLQPRTLREMTDGLAGEAGAGCRRGA